MRAVRRGQRRALLAAEIVVDGEMLIVPGQDEVGARPREVGMEQKLRVGNDQRVRRCMDLRGIDVDMRNCMCGTRRGAE